MSDEGGLSTSQVAAWVTRVQMYRIQKLVPLAMALFGVYPLAALYSQPELAVPLLGMAGLSAWWVHRKGTLVPALIAALPFWVPGLKLDPQGGAARDGAVHEVVLPGGTHAWLAVVATNLRMELDLKGLPLEALGDQDHVETGVDLPSATGDPALDQGEQVRQGLYDPSRGPLQSWLTGPVRAALAALAEADVIVEDGHLATRQQLAAETTPMRVAEVLGLMDDLGQALAPLAGFSVEERAHHVLQTEPEPVRQAHIQAWRESPGGPVRDAVLRRWVREGDGPSRVLVAALLPPAEALPWLERWATDAAEDPASRVAALARWQVLDAPAAAPALSTVLEGHDRVLLQALASHDAPELSRLAQARLDALGSQAQGSLSVVEPGREGELAVAEEGAGGRLSVPKG